MQTQSQDGLPIFWIGIMPTLTLEDRLPWPADLTRSKSMADLTSQIDGRVRWIGAAEKKFKSRWNITSKPTWTQNHIRFSFKIKKMPKENTNLMKGRQFAIVSLWFDVRGNALYSSMDNFYVYKRIHIFVHKWKSQTVPFLWQCMQSDKQTSYIEKTYFTASRAYTYNIQYVMLEQRSEADRGDTAKDTQSIDSLPMHSCIPIANNNHHIHTHGWMLAHNV